MPPGAYSGEVTDANVAAGQTITKTIGEYGPRITRAGILHGTVSLLQAVGAGGIEGPGSVSMPVGTFAVRVPRARHAVRSQASARSRKQRVLGSVGDCSG
jgi:hypothetical protein